MVKQAAEARLVVPDDLGGVPEERVALCMTSMRRFHQIKVALPLMLLQLWPLQEHIVLVLADLNQDEELSEFVEERLFEAVQCGLLVHMRSAEMPFWHACRAKNAAAFAAVGMGGICAVVNMDNDRVVGPNFATHLLRAFRDEGAAAVHYSTTWSPGTYGCIGMTTRVWQLLNGYDEEFKPSGCQDTDVLMRMRALGLQVNVCRDRAIVGGTLPNEAPGETAAQVKVKNVDPSLWERWGKMDSDNRSRMHINLAAGRLYANTSPTWAPLRLKRLHVPEDWSSEPARRLAPAALEPLAAVAEQVAASSSEPAWRRAPAALEPPATVASTSPPARSRAPAALEPPATVASTSQPARSLAPAALEPPAKWLPSKRMPAASSQPARRLAPAALEPSASGAIAVPRAVEARVQRLALFTFGWEKMSKVHPEHAAHWRGSDLRTVTMAMNATGYRMDHIINTLALHDPAARTDHLGFSIEVLRGIMDGSHRAWRRGQFEALVRLFRRLHGQ